MSERRNEITALATQAVQRSGLHSVSFRQLADEIGIKSSSVHYHFKTKSDLAEALISEYTENFSLKLQEIEATNDTLLGQLDDLIGVFEFVTKEQNLCLCGMMATELTELDEPTKKSLRNFFSVTESWLSSAFSRHKDEVKVALSPEQLSQVFVSTLEGAMLLDRADEDGKRLEAAHALARAFVR
ncbi:TetR/AcrR family transcriptional regulator [Leucothrix sargassi]|nr:TetR/AcrR family transcriptional regulator [Leucothrix sargassi]